MTGFLSRGDPLATARGTVPARVVAKLDQHKNVVVTLSGFGVAVLSQLRRKKRVRLGKAHFRSDLVVGDSLSLAIVNEILKRVNRVGVV